MFSCVDPYSDHDSGSTKLLNTEWIQFGSGSITLFGTSCTEYRYLTSK